jgi:hypothetical protein
MRPVVDRVWTVSVIAVCLLAPCCAKTETPKIKKVTAPVVATRPMIALSAKAFDFGKVPEGTVVEHTFEFSNEGDGELMVEVARTSCDCLTAGLSESHVLPGKNGYVKATFKTAGRPGMVNQKIYLTTDDSDNRRVSLTLQGEIVGDISVTPTAIWLGEVKRGEKVSRDLSIAVNAPEKVKLTSVTIDDKRFKLERKNENLKNTIEYQLLFSAGKAVEPVTADIAIGAEGAETPLRRIPVRGEVIGDLRYPKIVQFFNTGGQYPPVEVTVSSRSNKSFKITKVEDPDKLLKLQVLTASGPNAKIRAEIADSNPAHRPPSPGYRLIVSTTDKVEPKIIIAYVVSWNGPAPGRNIRRPPPATRDKSAAP